MERYKIGICELYNKNIHGYTDKMQGKYILAYELSLEEFMFFVYDGVPLTFGATVTWLKPKIHTWTKTKL